MKIFVEDQRLDILLKQYWPNDFFTSENEAEILIKNSEIFDKRAMKGWSITKPILLLQIINAIEHINEIIIDFGNGKFYPKRRIFKISDEVINLTQKETEILSYLANNPGDVDKAKLLNEVWGYSSDIDTNTLETHLYNLRIKLGNIY